MTKPASRFETVVNVKKHQEKLTQQQLTQIQDAHQREQGVLSTLEARKEEAFASTPKKGKTRATDLQAHRAFIFKLTRQISHQTQKVDEIRTKELEKRVELTGRVQSRQMVEKLDEKAKQEAARELDKREQELIDEVANRGSNTPETEQ